MSLPPAPGDKDAGKLQPYEGKLFENGWEAMRSWTPTSDETGWHLNGACPRCKHDADKYIPIEVTVSGLDAREARGEVETGKYVVQCNCPEAHPDQPKDQSGCGAYWGAEITSEEPPRVVGAASVGPDTLRWEKKAAELEFNALANVRGTAEKWAATLTAILGLAGTVLIARGAAEIDKLPDGTKIGIAILLAAALGAAAYATYRAALAAQGTPEVLKWPNGFKLRKWELDRAKKAKEHLHQSRQFTFVALTAIVLAVGLSWFGPKAESSSEGSKVVLTPATGQPLCGALVNSSTGLELEVDKARVALPPGPYDNVVPVDDCPKEKPDEDG
jgi:hypothetical protein